MTYRPENHSEELFFLDNFNVDRVFSTIKRADYLALFYIQAKQEASPDGRVYLADFAEEMHMRIPQASKMVEKLQSKGYVSWKTDYDAGRTYVELTSKAVELMNVERSWMKNCYSRIREEIGDEELARMVKNLQRMAVIIRETEAENPKADSAAG